MIRISHWILISLLLTGCAGFLKPQKEERVYDMNKPINIVVKGWLHEWDSGAADMTGVINGLKKNKENYIVVPTRTREGQEHNAKLIKEVIKDYLGHPKYIITGSRGTGEALIALANLSTKYTRDIKWVSYSGAHYGSPIADYWTEWYRIGGTMVFSEVVGWGWVGNIWEMRTKDSRKRANKLFKRIKHIPRVSLVSIRTSPEGLGPSRRIAYNICEDTGHEHDGIILAKDQVLPNSKAVLVYKNQPHMIRASDQYRILKKAKRILK